MSVPDPAVNVARLLLKKAAGPVVPYVAVAEALVDICATLMTKTVAY